MDQTFDKMFYSRCQSLAGIDEVGVTALAGPLVAACVVLPRLSPTDDLSLYLIDDSKKIREKFRNESAKIVQQNAIAYGLGVVAPMEIDALNIYIASNLAMKRAIDDCVTRFGSRSFDFCLIDGNRDIDINYPYHLVVKGDQKSLSIAAASVMAKVHRDNIMKELGRIHPEYGFAKNKGYKCDEHFAGLDQIGIWVGVHRISMPPFTKKRGDSTEWCERRKLWVNITEHRLHNRSYYDEEQ